jgi:hypothetical protein
MQSLSIVSRQEFLNLIRRTVIWAMLLTAGASCTRNRAPDITGSAEWLRDQALAEAKQDGKQLFLLFTSPDNEWSDRFDKFHADTDVRQVLDRHFVLLRIDRIDTPGGDYLYHVHGGQETWPAFAILDPRGMTLADSGSGAENIGFPVQPHEVEAYFEALKRACPELSDDDAALLRQRLNELRPTEAP